MHGGEKQAVTGCQTRKYTTLGVSENIAPPVELKVQGHEGAVVRQR